MNNTPVKKSPTVVSAYQLGSILLTFITLLFIPVYTHLEKTQEILRQSSFKGVQELLNQAALSLHLSLGAFYLLAAAAAIVLLIMISLYFFSEEPIKGIRILLIIAAILSCSAGICCLISCHMNGAVSLHLAMQAV